MPAVERSLHITDAYRQRLQRLHGLAGHVARWTVDAQDIDGSGQAWATRAAAQLQVLQAAGVTLTAGYLSAFRASELAAPPEPVTVSRAAVGHAQDGQPLAKALAASLITVKVALKDRRPPVEALALGQQRADRLAGTAVLSAPREALHSALTADPSFVGWRRVTSGGCGACLASANNVIHTADAPLLVHPDCRCSAEPVLRDAPDTFTRPSGRDLFDAMTPEQQASLLGEHKAELIRSGRVAFERLIQPDPMAVAPDGITEAPLAALT